MRLCVSHGIDMRLPDGTLLPVETSIATARRAGFEELDVDITSAMTLREDWRAGLDAIAEAAARAGMRIRYAHLPFDYPPAGDGEGWARFTLASMRAIEQAAAWGVDCAAIHPRSFTKTDYDADREYDAALTFLRPFCERARSCGLALGIEIMRGAGASAPARIRRFGTDTDVLIRLADELETGVCWDTGHGHISLQAQGKSIRKIGGRLKMVHINDNFAEDDVHLAPFLGRIDWAEVMKALKDIGYDGSLNLEVTCNRLPEPLREPYAAYMAAAGRYLIDLFDRA